MSRFLFWPSFSRVEAYGCSVAAYLIATGETGWGLSVALAVIIAQIIGGSQS